MGENTYLGNFAKWACLIRIQKRNPSREPIPSKKLIIGVLIWCSIAVASAIGLRHASEDSPQAAPQIIRHLTWSTKEVQIKFYSRQLVAVNDPVFVADTEPARPVGRVSRLGPMIESGDSSPQKSADKKIDFVNEATVTLFGGAPRLHDDATFILESTPQSTEWVIKTMLPKEKRRELVTLIMESYRRHMPEIAEAFEPVVQNSLTTASSVIRDDLQSAFEAREEQFQALGKRFEADLLQKRIVPLLHDEIWPVVEEKGSPLARKIGTEVWQELSLWRFGWRFLYDKSPLPERNFTEQEFNRFVKEKAAPILKAHLPDMLELQKSLVKEFADHPKIRETVRESFRTVVNDRELRDLLTAIFKEVLIENDRLKRTIEQQWTGPQARAAIDLASRKLDPTINRIGESMFGNPNKSITPEFARVLRRMVLHKDQRWLILDPGGNGSDDVVSKNESGFVYTALVGDRDSLIPSSVVPNRPTRSVD